MAKWKSMEVSEYLSPEEANSIIEACQNPRDKLILRVMWETGGRVSEVLALKPEHIIEKDNCIILKNLKQKTKKGGTPLKRVLLFSESTLVKDLLEFISDNSIQRGSWVFQGGVYRVSGREGQVSPTYIWYLLSSVVGTSYSSTKWKRKNGLATSLGISKIKEDIVKPAWPHLFRHGAAMNIYHRTQRLDITQEQLGHSSIMTTQGYAKLTQEDKKTIIDKS